MRALLSLLFVLKNVIEEFINFLSNSIIYGPRSLRNNCNKIQLTSIYFYFNSKDKGLNLFLSFFRIQLKKN